MKCESLGEHTKNIIDLEKKNATINKIRTKITSRCKSILHLQGKILKSLLKVTIIEKLEILVIIQVDIDAQHIVFAI